MSFQGVRTVIKKLNIPAYHETVTDRSAVNTTTGNKNAWTNRWIVNVAIPSPVVSSYGMRVVTPRTPKSNTGTDIGHYTSQDGTKTSH